jgi:myotubularin-related protein 3/4
VLRWQKVQRKAYQGGLNQIGPFYRSVLGANMDGGSEQPSSMQSICHVRACELYPKRTLQAEDVHLSVPFVPVCGEGVEFLERTVDGILALSNYRLHLLLKDTYYSIPLGLIEVIEVKDIFCLHIGCKDARLLR